MGKKKEEFLKELSKKLIEIAEKQSVFSSTVKVYSNYNQKDKKGYIGNISICHFAVSYSLDSVRFVDYDLNPRIESSIEKMEEHLGSLNIEYKTEKDNNATYGYTIWVKYNKDK